MVPRSAGHVGGRRRATGRGSGRRCRAHLQRGAIADAAARFTGSASAVQVPVLVMGPNSLKDTWPIAHFWVAAPLHAASLALAPAPEPVMSRHFSVQPQRAVAVVGPMLGADGGPALPRHHRAAVCGHGYARPVEGVGDSAGSGGEGPGRCRAQWPGRDLTMSHGPAFPACPQVGVRIGRDDVDDVGAERCRGDQRQVKKASPG
jgi:hypothetical protein